MEKEQEDLEFNHFFVVVKQRFSELTAGVPPDQLLILVPQQSSLPEFLTQELVVFHVFGASPYYLNQYVTPARPQRSVEIDGSKVSTRNGFKEPRTVNVLFEELFYNREDQAYRVLCIDRPLFGKSREKPVAEPVEGIAALQRSYHYFRTDPGNKMTVSRLNQNIQQFNSSMVFVRGCEDFAVKRLTTIVDNSMRTCIEENAKFANVQEGQKKFSDIYQVIECYLMRGVYNHVFGSLCVLYAEEDARYLHISRAFAHFSLSEWQASAEVQTCDLTGPIAELKSLDRFRAPMEKMFCLQDVHTQIAHSMENAVRHARSAKLKLGRASPAVSEAFQITADELIPVFVFVTSQSKLKHLYSTLLYIRKFQLSSAAQQSRLGYTFSSFEACVAFLIQKYEEASQSPKAMKLLMKSPVMSSRMLSGAVPIDEAPPQYSEDEESPEAVRSSTQVVFPSHSSQPKKSKGGSHRSSTLGFASEPENSGGSHRLRSNSVDEISPDSIGSVRPPPLPPHIVVTHSAVEDGSFTATASSPPPPRLEASHPPSPSLFVGTPQNASRRGGGGTDGRRLQTATSTASFFLDRGRSRTNGLDSGAAPPRFSPASSRGQHESPPPYRNGHGHPELSPLGRSHELGRAGRAGQPPPRAASVRPPPRKGVVRSPTDPVASLPPPRETVRAPSGVSRFETPVTGVPQRKNSSPEDNKSVGGFLSRLMRFGDETVSSARLERM